MKTIIVILAFLFSFSFLQAQVKTIDFVIRTKIPIEEIEGIIFSRIPKNSILEICSSNKSLSRYYCCKIESISFVNNKDLKFLSIKKKESAYNSKDLQCDTININAIDSIIIAQDPIKATLRISGMKATIKTVSRMSYYPDKIKDDSSLQQTDLNIDYTFQNNSVINYADSKPDMCSYECKIPEGVLQFISDTSISVSIDSSSGLITTCGLRKTQVILDTVNHVIKSLASIYTLEKINLSGTFSLNKQEKKQLVGTRKSLDSTYEEMQLVNIPYNELNGVIQANIGTNEIYNILKYKCNIQKYYNFDGGVTEKVSIMHYISPSDSAKIEIKIYK